jgi:hypothetical protein
MVTSLASSRPARANVSAAVSYQSPERAALSWFLAINRKDKAAVVAHFEPASPGHGKWLNGDQARQFLVRLLAPAAGWAMADHRLRGAVTRGFPDG